MNVTPLPEFFGPIGKGCFHCYDGEPEEAFDWGLLCLGCVAGWFPEVPEAWIQGWLHRQRDVFEALQVKRPQVGTQLSIFDYIR